MRTTAITLVLILCLTLPAPTASAYELWGFTWPATDNPLAYWINPSDAPSGFSSAVQAGAATWGQHGEFEFDFAYQGTSSVHGVAYDGVHLVHWEPNGDGMDGSTLAVTWAWFSGGTGHHFDMAFNGTHAWSTNPGPGQFDIESVALHEFGHALGLGHSNQSGAVMYPYISSNTVARSLHTDDIAGAAALYPASGGGDPLPGTPEAIAPTGAISDTTPTFSWTAASDAGYYELVVELAGGGVVYSDIGATGTSHTSSTLATGESYVWRVRAHNGEGAGGWSSDAAFSITDAQPGTPTLIAPLGTISETTPTFAWTAAANATHYELYVRRLGQSQPTIHLQSLAATEHTPGSALSAETDYEWWVRAHNGGVPGSWSARGTFDIASTQPGVPTALAPLGQISDERPTFSWTAAANATHYELLVQADGASDPVIHESQVAGTELPATATLVPGAYSWWVRAYNGGQAGAWSKTAAFEVLDSSSGAPGPTQLTAPTGRQSPGVQTFVWTAATDATHYELLVRNARTGQTVYHRVPLSGTRHTSTLSFPRGVYDAWILPWNGEQAGQWSSRRRFRVRHSRKER